MMAVALMRHSNQPLSEIKSWEWEELLWVYDELVKGFGSTQTTQSKPRNEVKSDGYL